MFYDIVPAEVIEQLNDNEPSIPEWIINFIHSEQEIATRVNEIPNNLQPSITTEQPSIRSDSRDISIMQASRS